MNEIYEIGADAKREYDGFDVMDSEMVKDLQLLKTLSVKLANQNTYSTTTADLIWNKVHNYKTTLVNSALGVLKTAPVDKKAHTSDTKEWADMVSKFVARVNATWDMEPEMVNYRTNILKALKDNSPTVSFSNTRFIITSLTKLANLREDLKAWRKLLIEADRYNSESATFKMLNTTNTILRGVGNGIYNALKSTGKAVEETVVEAAKGTGQGIGGFLKGVFSGVGAKLVIGAGIAYVGYKWWEKKQEQPKRLRS